MSTSPASDVPHTAASTHIEGTAFRNDRPITILIAALGGEGGGVLTQWLVEAALHAGYPVQSTSIPGVAQRTGATTYYVEIFPEPLAALGGVSPIFNLGPVAGRIDLLVASELLEAVRALQAGYVDRERTMVIASTSRTLTTHEKIAMGDGRADSERLAGLLVAHSRRHVGFDMNAEASAARTVISAVMFGAVAGSGLLPFESAHCEAAIAAGGKVIAASLAGFARGYADAEARPELAGDSEPEAAATVFNAAVDDDVANPWPADVREMVGHGHARLVDYQDARYAALYEERVRRLLALEDALDPSGLHGHAMTREAARFLALWMAFDDVIRVADLKTRAERYARIREEVGARPGDLVTVHDYFKPRLVEVAGLLPKTWSRRLLAWEASRKRKGKSTLAFPLKLRSDSHAGYLMLRVLASTRRWRPKSQRYADEQRAIERWLEATARVARSDWAPAHELALCGRLIKGYGDTNARAHENMTRILDTLASEDAVTVFASDPLAHAEAIRSARDAALADPEGKALDRDIARHGAAPRPVVAKPMIFVRPHKAH
ncbi:MAG: indolepyruvate oxidoreductase subunit beta family protein [Burkholderiaceae bacterium]